MNNEMLFAALLNVRKVEKIRRKIIAKAFRLSARETANDKRNSSNHCRRKVKVTSVVIDLNVNPLPRLSGFLWQT